MRVLIASGIDGFCHRYGPLHWAEQLATQDIAASVRAHSDPRLAADLEDHDLLLLYRVPDGDWIRHLCGRAAALARPTVFAVDDLIVAPELPDPPLLRRRSDAERRLWHDGVRRYRRTLEAADALLATTEPIAAVGRELGLPTALHRQGVSAIELALGAAARAAPPASVPGRVRLGYFSGTATHDADLATIAAPLAAVLARHPEVELLLVGPVTPPAALAALGERIVRHDLVDWAELPALVATCAASLVPLEWRDSFTAAKGAVKYLEAATVSVPVIASPIPAFRDAVRDGVTGWLAADDAAWAHALTTVVTHPEHAAHVGARARSDAELRFAPAAQGRPLAAFLSSVVAGLRAAKRSRLGRVARSERELAAMYPGEVARAARQPAAQRDAYAAPGTAASAPLGSGQSLTQAFTCHHDGLCRVDLHTVTYGLALDHRLTAVVRRDDGTVAVSRELWAGVAPDRDWLAIELPTETGSAGRTYVIELGARGTGERNALSFTLAATPAAAPYALDGIPAAASLALRAFTAWPAT